jgi:nucleoside-diphosphate-sugar epimerase
MRIAITGASGNLGTALIRALRAQEPATEIVGICRRPPEDSSGGVEWRRVDLSVPEVDPVLTDALAGCDAVVHLAWAIQPVRDTEWQQRVNIGGTAAMLRCAAAAGVPHVVHASSLGAYAPGGGGPVDESWPTTGIATLLYSRHKAQAEAMLDEFVLAHPAVTVSRIRPTLVLQRNAASEIASLFLGPLVPIRAVRLIRGRLPVLPLPRGLKVQFVHADDVADALVRIVSRRASGAFNLAADVLGPRELADVFGARPLEMSPQVFRGLVTAAFRVHAIPTSPGWFDQLVEAPLLDSTRAHRDLGWEPRLTSRQAADDLLDGFEVAAEGPTPALQK